mmetsp:Transcript_82627/g.252505  ORF Transcript_82627/g.252505 Transcript_82627/m.252505 type:complete len:245 (-) Transcript_82627:457-1191(-)
MRRSPGEIQPRFLLQRDFAGHLVPGDRPTFCCSAELEPHVRHVQGGPHAADRRRDAGWRSRRLELFVFERVVPRPRVVPRHVQLLAHGHGRDHRRQPLRGLERRPPRPARKIGHSPDDAGRRRGNDGFLPRELPILVEALERCCHRRRLRCPPRGRRDEVQARVPSTELRFQGLGLRPPRRRRRGGRRGPGAGGARRRFSHRTSPPLPLEPVAGGAGRQAHAFAGINGAGLRQRDHRGRLGGDA